MPFLLRQAELVRIERERAGGVSSREVVEIFAGRGAQLSAATFRKYVQAGLLPRSRRVGRRGKHRGSRGLYPVAVVRRIDLIKGMMAAGLTLADIGESDAAVRHRLEDLRGDWSAVVAELATRARRQPGRREVERELSRAEREMRSALRRVERVGGRVARAREEELERAG